MSGRTSPAVLVALAFGACVVRPAGEAAERDRAAAAGAAYQTPFPKRELPQLGPDATLADWIACAELGNGALEAAWYRWIVALEQVPQDSTQPTTAMFGITHELGYGTTLDRTGIALMSDAMDNVLWPGRLGSQGEAALARARVAAAEFDVLRLRLRRDVAEAWHALALRDEEIRLQERLRGVLDVNVPSVRARVAAGAVGQDELLRAEVASLRTEAELAALRESRPALVATLRAAAAVEPGRGDPRPALPDLEPLGASEQEWVERALERSPELEVRRREHDSALAAITVREWARVPSFALSAGILGDPIGQFGAAVTMPFLRSTAIEAAVRQADAEASAARALIRQEATDSVARVLSELALRRALEREEEVLAGRLLPRLQQATAVARASWSAGTGGFAAWADAVALEVVVGQRLARLRADAAIGKARLAEEAGER
jgi:outer membrane protein TolC